ncbi:hypothetical protein B0T20DRAFT_478066 [Sordaria brevicollis]|uniref:Uncharacterized protein n=1 Tax=Sordaria brevicollis TaxID=83679 RepID=A0AAE0UDI7_SORBR|nr:hypothetical protein B0T20DRAFT_478066 [Sordaria brevicollis]
MPVVGKTGPVICNGTNPPKSRKSGAPTTSKSMNPEAPVFVPKGLVPTPPSPVPLPEGVKYQYRVPIQQPYYSGHVYETYALVDGRRIRRTASDLGIWSVASEAEATPQQAPRPQTAPANVPFADVPPHEEFGVNATREVMALLGIEYHPRGDGTPKRST